MLKNNQLYVFLHVPTARRRLAEMSRAGLRVPAGFTIPTEVCEMYTEKGKQSVDEIWTEVIEGIRFMEKTMGRTFAGKSRGGPAGVMPLLVSVRSGAAASMPGALCACAFLVPLHQPNTKKPYFIL